MYLTMYLSADNSSWPETVLVLGTATLGFLMLGSILAGVLEWRKTNILARQEAALRQLVQRYEQLAEHTADSQQRIATDVSDLRSRTTSIEQLLRTVE